MTRSVHLAYGTQGLVVDLPADRTTVVEPRWEPTAADPPALLREALRAPVAGPPLRERVQQGQTVAISVCDGTRPQPRELMIRRCSTSSTASSASRTSSCSSRPAPTAATPTPSCGPCSATRSSTRPGGQPRRARRLQLTWMGTLRRRRPGLAQQRVGAGRRPHHDRLRRAALLRRLLRRAEDGHARASPASRRCSSLHDARGSATPTRAGASARATPCTTTSAHRGGVDRRRLRPRRRAQPRAGDHRGIRRRPVRDARGRPRALAARSRWRRCEREFEVVLTTNAGYPLDQNLYQAVKGMSAAAQVVQPGGLIVCAAECRDGFPDHGSYREVLAVGGVAAGAVRRDLGPRRTVPDQWQVQVQAKISMQGPRRRPLRAPVRRRPARGAPRAGARPRRGRRAAPSREAGPDARLCVLPEGPMTIPYLV